LAGFSRLAAAGELEPNALVVAVLTGTGLKDPATAESIAGRAGVIEAAPTVGSVAVALGW
jgi:threonine synthase